MNVIIFLFTIIAACFVGSGLSNVVTVLNGTDYFFKKAEIGDLFIVDYGDGQKTVNRLTSLDCVQSVRQDSCLLGMVSDISVGRKKFLKDNNMLMIQKVYSNGVTFFDENNNPIRSVKEGEVYLPAKLLDLHELKVGDKICVTNHGVTTKPLTIAGSVKDALFSTTMMGSSRILLSDADYTGLVMACNQENSLGNIICVKTTDTGYVNGKIADIKSISMTMTAENLKLAYIMYMIVAMVVLAISVCLILVSFVVLKYVITFSINEEFREIGIMKAIGIRSAKIRSLFAVKYACIAVVGSTIGFFISIPFGNMLITSVSDAMVLGNETGIRLNLLGALVVSLLMVGLSYYSTRKVKKCTPLDAIRCGQTGERYHQKIKRKLSASKMSNPLFLAVNDILSAPKRYITIMISFFLCSVFTFGLVLMADTMRSDRLITSFGIRSDIYLDPEVISRRDRDYIVQGKYSKDPGLQKEQSPYTRSILEIEDLLKEENMPGRVCAELFYAYKIKANGVEKTQYFEQDPYISMKEYTYSKGTAPVREDEIAITDKVSKELGVGIGDTITVDFGSEKKNCVVTAFFTTMNQLGDCILLNNKAPTDPKDVVVMMKYQINFKDHPSQKVIDERVQKLQKLYHTKDVMNATDYVVECMKSADAMDAVVRLLVIITLMVVILVAILMERSFISDEEGSIALLRAIGFSEGSIILWHVLRFMFVALAAELLAVILTLPLTHLWSDPIWAMMGQAKIHYYFKPLSLLVCYPGLILAVTLLAASLTALYTRKIKAKDIITIE